MLIRDDINRNCYSSSKKVPVFKISRTKQQQQQQQQGYAPNPQYLKLGVDGYTMPVVSGITRGYNANKPMSSAPAMMYAPATMPGRHAVDARGVVHDPQVSLR